MTRARTGVAVALAHALLLAAGWHAGLETGIGFADAAMPLQVRLLDVPARAAPVPQPLPVLQRALPAPVQPTLAAIPPVIMAAAPADAAPPAAPEPPRPAPPPEPATTPATASVVAESPPPPAQTQADRRHCPSAHHPALLRERGIEGVVHLRVRVDAAGLPAEVNVTTGSGWALMDQAALAQARGCRFEPARRAGRAVESWVEFAVRFVLNG